MPSEPKKIEPQLYFLNERHQLAPSQKTGGGPPGEILGVDWASHGDGLKKGIETLRATRREMTRDPTAKSRAFVLAQPTPQLERASTAKDAVGGKLARNVSIRGEDSQVIQRLGFNLLEVREDGSAIVHATDERLEQMTHSLEILENLNRKDQNKWAHLDSITEIPLEFKASLDWWPGEVAEASKLDAEIDLQPFLDRDEVDAVIKEIKASLGPQERLKRIGKEYTGRVWILATLFGKTVLSLAQEFQAIFSIHPPIEAVTVGGGSPSGSTAAEPESEVDARQLPCVAIMDTGIPPDHLHLGRYIRRRINGQDTGGQVCDDHGSFVASRAVFGDIQCDGGAPTAPLDGVCAIYDIRLGDGPGQIYAPAVIPALETMASAAPDVRVFNLSFDSTLDLEAMKGGHRSKYCRQVEALDNKIFSDDILVVVAAGNSQPNVVPNESYPNHYKDPQWKLRAWSRAFNAITCGGTADNFVEDGVANEEGAPSPFTRVGPGFAKSPKPDFSAHAGNANEAYQFQPGSGHGVWGSSDQGLWEDNVGTSFAAPLLARDAAWTFHVLQQRCESGSRPFACLVKACLALFAERPPLSAHFKKLADLAIGYGPVKFEGIEDPSPDHAVFLWQGILADEKDLLTVELPLPGQWIKEADEPVLHLVAAWDSPVNHAAEDIWTCRTMEMLTLRPRDGAKAIPSKKLRGSTNYTLLKRAYHLDEDKLQLSEQDSCLLDLKYSHQQMAPYPEEQEFSPEHRIGIAYELRDAGAKKVSPHEFVQSLPVASSLNRLSHRVPASRQAVKLKVQPTV